jgi:N-glycosylase/DNA lyase
MRIKIEDDFDLKKIADSGQCFRFNESGDGFDVLASDKYLFIKEIGNNEYELSCDEADYEGFWKNYFDLGLSYRDVRGLIDEKKDDYLYRASEFGQGIRILKQDPWEMLISFIISQRKNIPAIKASIEKLCEKAGRKIGENSEGKAIYSFPTPEELVKLTMEDLSACSLGYRDKYIYKAARDVLDGTADLEAWEKLSDEELMEKLLSLFGVGVKVANCEILFGYHRLDAFPKDVWINRVLENHYPGGFSFEDYAPYNGIMQQYLFYYSRLQSMN